MLKINENTLPQTPLAEGGEGYIYEWGEETLLKVFKPLINKEEKRQKIERLMKKDLPKEVVQPLEAVYNQHNQFIGYLMKKITGDELRKLANKKYVSLHRITSKDVLHMLSTIKDVLKQLHAQSIYIGDLNDSNVLFDQQNGIHLIDVDSWAVDEFPCQVCMETFKDPLLQLDQFNEKTDYYAFSILFFKSMTRLHPFGGTLVPEMDLVERMKQGISVIGNDVKIPRNVNNWTFFSPKVTDGLKKIFDEKKRFLLDAELTEFKNQLTFCTQHGDFYFRKFDQCPVCHQEAKVVVRPMKLANAANIPLHLVSKPEDIRLFINQTLYLNQQDQLISLHTKKAYPYHREESVYISRDGHFVYRVFPNKIEVRVEKTKQVAVFEKINRSPVVIEENVFYYQSTNLTLQQVHVSEKGNTTKTLAKTSFRLRFHAVSDTAYLLVNHYDQMTIFNVNGYHYTLSRPLEAQKTALHFDPITKRWLVIVETAKGDFQTFVFENNRLVFETNTLTYLAPIDHVCFSNNTLFTPQEGFIRGLQIEKFQYKDFPCAIVNENSVLTREKKSFTIVNETEIYTFG